MTADLFFIYDTHCPWSYAVTPLVEAIAQHLPEINLHFWHNAFFDGENGVSVEQVKSVQTLSPVKFSADYMANLNEAKDSTLTANVLAWTHRKIAHKTLPLLKAMQIAHFQQGLALTTPEEIKAITESVKVSPPEKALTIEKLTKDAEFTLLEIFEMQEIINTKAIPALLLAIDDNLILLNHNLYLDNPHAIVEAVKLELTK
jgi:protein-disulfide isomerase-like protein with CxxC motif